MEFVHRPVLLEPTVDALIDSGFGARAARRPSGAAQNDSRIDRSHGIFVDGTFGRGGHSRLLVSRLAADAGLIVFDKDPQAIDSAHLLRSAAPRVEVIDGGVAGGEGGKGGGGGKKGSVG